MGSFSGPQCLTEHLFVVTVLLFERTGSQRIRVPQGPNGVHTPENPAAPLP